MMSMMSMMSMRIAKMIGMTVRTTDPLIAMTLKSMSMAMMMMSIAPTPYPSSPLPTPTPSPRPYTPSQPPSPSASPQAPPPASPSPQAAQASPPAPRPPPLLSHDWAPQPLPLATASSCARSGNLDDAWRTGTPAGKRRNRGLPGSYRPVALCGVATDLQPSSSADPRGNRQIPVLRPQIPHNSPVA